MNKLSQIKTFVLIWDTRRCTKVHRVARFVYSKKATNKRKRSMERPFSTYTITNYKVITVILQGLFLSLPFCGLGFFYAPYYSKIYTLAVLLPKFIHSCLVLKNRSILLPLIAPPVSPATALP